MTEGFSTIVRGLLSQLGQILRAWLEDLAGRRSVCAAIAASQITLPVEVRNALNAGDWIEFVQIAPGRHEFVGVTSEVTELAGMFGPAKKTVSIQAMNAATAKRGAAAR